MLDRRGETICEFWRKQYPTERYHYDKNNYVFINKTNIYWIDDDFKNYSIIGNDFKFNIDNSVFQEVNESILHNANEYVTHYRKDKNIEKILNECSNLETGFYSSHLRLNVYTDKKEKNLI